MTEQINIIRVEHSKENPYFMMNRDTAQDDSLTWEARGVLAYLLSKPDDWQVMVVDLQQKCGRDKVRHILDELKAAKYLRIIPARNTKGKFSKAEYQVFEQPFTGNPTTDVPYTALPTTGNPATAKPETAKRPLQSIDKQKTEKQSKENKENAPNGATPPKQPKKFSYPSNAKSWEWKHLEQYACENPAIELLAALEMNAKLKNLTTKQVAQDAVELFKELNRNNISQDRWQSLYTAGLKIKNDASPFKKMLWALPSWLKAEPKITMVDTIVAPPNTPEELANGFKTYAESQASMLGKSRAS
jgi:hypothetical protein